MPNNIALDLLLNAKEQLSSGEYEKAANSARGVLALDANNTDAKDILTAAKAIQGHDSEGESEQTSGVEKTEPESSASISLAEQEIRHRLGNQIRSIRYDYELATVKSELQKLRLRHQPADLELMEMLGQVKEIRTSDLLPSRIMGTARSHKSFVGTLLLCVLLGGLGIHRFYVGKIGTGILMFLTLGGLGIWMLIDLVTIATSNFTDSDGMPITA